MNPFRYRGYVYDEETGLYYLRTRYYHAQLLRFICADSEIGQIGDRFSHNIFAYCDNNPIINTDPTGLFSWKALAWAGVIIAAAGLLVLATISTGGGALALASAGITASAATATANAAIGAGLATTVGAGLLYAKQAKRSPKERATDRPSWVNRGDIIGNDAHENAVRMMNEKFGVGNWTKATAEGAFSKILKWLTRDVGLK